MTDFTYALDADGVAVITWDVPGKSMNVMSMEGFAELDGHVDRALADPAVKGIVLTSGKADFAGGMDLNVIAAMRSGGTSRCLMRYSILCAMTRVLPLPAPASTSSGPSMWRTASRCL